MAFFGVTLENIDTIKPIENADRIVAAKLKGMDFQFVIGKDQFKEGEMVLYFPLDSLVPQEILKKLGLEGKLSGKDKNRIRTVRLKNTLSQGIVASTELVENLVTVGNGQPSSEQITKHLGVTKYEAPIIPCQSGLLVGLPTGQSVYDIEGADRYVNSFNELLDKKVLISEKIEGSNWSITKTTDEKIFVNQRKHGIQEVEGKEHDWWKVARKMKFIDIVKKYPKQRIEIYGEMVGPGIQGNYYQLKNHAAPIYDVKIDNEFLAGKEFLGFVDKWMLNDIRVPIVAKNVILKDWLNGKTVQEMSNGQTMLQSVQKPREGIVIRPYDEELRNDEIGRLIIKQRSPEYLLEEK